MVVSSTISRSALAYSDHSFWSLVKDRRGFQFDSFTVELSHLVNCLDIHQSIVRYLWFLGPSIDFGLGEVPVFREWESGLLSSGLLPRCFGFFMDSGTSFLVLTDKESSFLNGLCNLLNPVLLTSCVRIRRSRRLSWNLESWSCHHFLD